MTLPKFKKIEINRYKPGKSKILRIRKVIKLSANESALGTSKKALKVLLKKNNIFKYPDNESTNLRIKIAKNFSLDEQKIICGSGSDEVIQILCQLFLEPGDEVIVPEYSFLMYRIYSKISGAKVKFAKEKNFKVSIKNILKNVTKFTKIVFIANPNNPTGTYLTKKELILLRKKLRSNILLVLDDAYVEYVKHLDYLSALKLFKGKENVFILRTFSKIYGLAALRVGWGYGSRKIIKAMNNIKPPFNVNKLAQIAAIKSLEDKNFLKKSVAHNIIWGNKIKNQLNKYDISTNKVNTNFLLLNFNNCKFSSKYVKKKLEKKGIILRSMESYNIKNCLRLTIGNVSENKKLILNLKRIFSKK